MKKNMRKIGDRSGIGFEDETSQKKGAKKDLTSEVEAIN